MTSIFTRSPFIVEVDVASQISTKVELYIASGTDAIPTSPTYTLSKLIAASNKPETQYNVSPYLREYSNFNSITSAYSSDQMNTDTYGTCTIKVYANTGAGFVLSTTTTYFFFDGYGYYEDGSNPNLGRSLMTEGTYYYNYDSTIDLAADFNEVPSSIGVPLEGLAGEQLKATYTNLVSGATTSSTKTAIVAPSGSQNVARQFKSVINAYYADGNKVEIIDNVTTTVLATYYFYPKETCKYTPIKCDFVNKFGQYQRLWFYAASNDSIEVTSKEHNALQSSITSYNQIQGQRKEFNLNGKESIKVNTDWVDEDFKDILKEIMLSEKILIDGKPAKLKTKSTELFKNINTKQINYTLEFEFNYNTINNVS